VNHLQQGQAHHDDQSPDKEEYAKLKEARLHVDRSPAACCHRLHPHRRGTWKIPGARAENAGRTGTTERTPGNWRSARNALKHGKKAGTLHLSKVIQHSRPVQALVVQIPQRRRRSPKPGLGFVLSSELKSRKCYWRAPSPERRYRAHPFRPSAAPDQLRATPFPYPAPGH